QSHSSAEDTSRREDVDDLGSYVRVGVSGSCLGPPGTTPMSTPTDEWTAADDLRDTYGHSPVEKMFKVLDVYGIGFEPRRAERRPLRFGLIGAGGGSPSKRVSAIDPLRTLL